MKTGFTIIKQLIVLCGGFATTTALGQTIYTWTNSAGGDLATSANWNPNGVPNPMNSDVMLFDGQSSGPVAATSNTGGQTSASGGAWGLNIQLTPNQTNPVDIYTTDSISTGIRMNNITIDAGAGGFSLGNNTLNVLDTIWGGVSGQIHNLVNNSTNAATIYPNLRMRFGGGGVHTFVFDGTGNWNVTNYLHSVETEMLIVKQGSGTMFWTGGSVPNAQFGGSVATPVTISSGTLVLESSNLLNLQAIVITNGTLAYNAAGQLQTLSGVISGNGALMVKAGTLTLSGANTFAGTYTVSGGALFINNNDVATSTTVNAGMFGGTGALSGPVTLAAGATLAPGAAAGSVGTLTISNNLSIGGNVAIEINKSLSPSNDFVVVTGALTNTGTGTLTVANLGPALAVGDTFTLFSQPLQNGAAVSVTGASANWVNHLAVDGSITVGSLIVPPALTFTQNGRSIQFSWSGNFKLQAQTNSLNMGIGNGWADYPGGGTSPATVQVDAANATVFFRLVSVP